MLIAARFLLRRDITRWRSEFRCRGWEVSATQPSRYRVVKFPARRGASYRAEQPLPGGSGPVLDSRTGERNARGPVLTGTARALTVQRITEPGGDGPDRYHYVITFRVKTPGRGPYDFIRMYRNMKRIRPYEGDAWEVQVSESDRYLSN